MGGLGDAGGANGDAGSGDPAYREAAVGWVAGACGAGAAGSEIQSPTLRVASRRLPYVGGGAGVVGSGTRALPTGTPGRGTRPTGGRLARRGGPKCENETETPTGSWQVGGIRSPPTGVSDSLHKTLDEWQPGFELVGFGDELLDALLADGEL